jgi:ABC-2 type transport system permease protein
MITEIFWISALSLWRDRSGLLMVFLLPPLVFVIFASVFTSAAEGRLHLRAGAVDAIGTAQSRRLIDALERRLGGRLMLISTPSALREEILTGTLDAGVVLSGELGGEAAPARILVHPGRRAAGQLLEAEVNAAARTALAPDLARRVVRRLEPALGLTLPERARLDALPLPATPPPEFTRTEILGGGNPLVIYYAGAVATLFLMFTAAQGAMISIDERHAGLQLRLGLSAQGPLPVLLGRLVWLTVLGAAQSLLIFAVAALLYRTPFFEGLLPLSATLILAAAASGGLGLLLASACASRQQAQAASTVLILTLAAVGGSMAPRFLMPPFLQTLGWLTPHAWAIEACETILWRGKIDGVVLGAWAVLAAFALGSVSLSLGLEARRRL